MVGQRSDKWVIGQSGLKKVTGETSDRPQLAVIVGGNSDEKSTKSGVREIFVRVAIRRDGRCVSGSMVIIGEERRLWGPRQKLGLVRS